MRVLCCGDRNWSNTDRCINLDKLLDNKENDDSNVINNDKIIEEE